MTGKHACMHVHACMYYLCSYSCGVFVISAAAKQVHNKPAVELCDVKVKVSSHVIYLTVI